MCIRDRLCTVRTMVAAARMAESQVERDFAQVGPVPLSVWTPFAFLDGAQNVQRYDEQHAMSTAHVALETSLGRVSHGCRDSAVTQPWFSRDSPVLLTRDGLNCKRDAVIF